MAKPGRPIPVASVTETPLLELRGNLRVLSFTSERGARWNVLAVGGINAADAVEELIGTAGSESVRLVIYGAEG